MPGSACYNIVYMRGRVRPTNTHGVAGKKRGRQKEREGEEGRENTTKTIEFVIKKQTFHSFLSLCSFSIIVSRVAAVMTCLCGGAPATNCSTIGDDILK